MGSSSIVANLSLSPSLSIMDNMSNDTPQPQYLKLEDLQSASSPGQSSFDTPSSVIIHSRPAKKRKSWGQELPEPKTSLPPRKRAKTDDEKEQRRIERIKRNRAAAHNSRERKRQETENLAVLLARARAEIDAYRRLHGPLPADIVLPEVTLNKDPESPNASECFPSPATSLIDSMPVKSEPSDTITPLSLFEEAANSTPLAIPSLDTTQHSAAMLCDLQCLSSRTGIARRSNRRQTSSRSSSSSHTSPQQIQQHLINKWWTRLFLYLIHLHIQSAYRAVLVSLWTVSPSRMQALMHRSLMTRSTTTLSSSTTSSTRTPLQLSQSNQLLAQLRAATSRTLQKGALAALARRPVVRPTSEGNVNANDQRQSNQSESAPIEDSLDDGARR